MIDIQNFIIAHEYKLSNDDIKAINQTKSEPPVRVDWEKRNNGICAFKKRIKDYLYENQYRLCAYCRCKINRETANEHIEHIVDKNRHPEWMFEPRNLCMACEKCNSFKNDNQVLTNPNIKKFPTKKKDFVIVNPFLDIYFENIEIIDGILYKGLTEKGKKTIEFCHLYRNELIVSRATNKINIDNNNTILGVLLKLVEEKGFDNTKTNSNIEKIKNAFTAELRIWKSEHI